MFYVYCVKNRFVKINTAEISCGLVKKIDGASCWTDKKQAKSWKIWVENRYKNVLLREATLSIKT